MSRFGSTDYNPTGGSSGNSSDYKERETFLLDSYCLVEFTLADLGVYEGDYGTSIILNMDDVEVCEGVLTERQGDGRLKVMDWGRWYDRDENMSLVPFDGSDEITTDDLGRVISESAGNNDYKYNLTDGILEGRDSPEDIGDRDLWLGNSKKSRTLAKVLSQHGHDVIDQDNKRDDYNWLAVGDSDFQLRDELEGRRFLMWFKDVTIEPDEDNDLEETVTFTDTVLLDAETEVGITIVNDQDEGGIDSDESDSDDDFGVDTPDESGGGQFPEDVDDLIDMFARSGPHNRESIQTVIEEEAPADYEVDMDTVMSEIESREE